MIRSVLDLLSPPVPAVIPEGEVVYAIGDVHGRIDLLMRMFDAIEKDRRELNVSKGRIIVLGDMIDRGPSSVGVLKEVLSPVEGRMPLQALMGNHEQAFLWFLDQPSPRRLGWVLSHGLAVIEELGIAIEDRDIATPERLRDKVVSRIDGELIKALRALPNLIEIEGFLFCHAGGDRRRGPARQTEDDLLWGAGTEAPSGSYGRRVVHGHYEVTDVKARGSFLCVDTGAWKTGRLSAARIVGSEVEIIEVKGDPA